jgi:hypothetical protein
LKPVTGGYVTKHQIAAELVPVLKKLLPTASGKDRGKGVIEEADKMPVERTDDFTGFTIGGNSPHLNQPNST